MKIKFSVVIYSYRAAVPFAKKRVYSRKFWNILF